MSNDFAGIILNDRYQITKHLGAGGFGVVLQAYDHLLDREVAVKLIQPGYALAPAAVDAFLREARAIARLDHPNIVTVFDLGVITTEDWRLPFLVMQLAAGGSLADRLRTGPLSLPEARRVLAAVCDALDYAHGRGIIHLDLKPLNILFDKRDSPLVADFGLSKMLEQATRVKADTRAGTLAYMAPEQLFGAEAGPFTDVYALGITFHEMLTGELPRRSWDGAVQFDRVLPDEVLAALRTATQTDPGRRFSSVGALAQALSPSIEPHNRPVPTGAKPAITRIQPLNSPPPRRRAPANIAKPVIPPVQHSLRVEDVLPPPFKWVEIPWGKVKIESYPWYDGPIGISRVAVIAIFICVFGLIFLFAVSTESYKREGADLGWALCLGILGLLAVIFYLFAVWDPDARSQQIQNAGTYTVSDFSIAQYPITNAQYSVFVEADDGYRNPEWWNFSSDAVRWRKHNNRPPFDDPADSKRSIRSITDTRLLQRASSRPQRITWYEAVAFCRWLSAKTGEAITLPAEEQWQRAAQGDRGHTFPWGNTFDPQRCNTKESRIGETTHVDRYPNGASPYRVLDMSGNVWEWCLEEWRTNNKDLGAKGYRMRRGGSHNDDSSHARCAHRDKGHPNGEDSHCGFRIVRAPSRRKV